MKTLDEVIEALNVCGVDEPAKCPYFDSWHWSCCGKHQMNSDALQYLREYRDAKNALDAERERYIEAYCQWKDAREKLEAQTIQMMWVDKHFQFEISDNPPLDWEQLKQMEGKPVWVVRTEKYCDPHWAIVDKVYKWDSIDDSSAILKPDDEELFLSDLGKTWQAYRKEKR